MITYNEIVESVLSVKEGDLYSELKLATETHDVVPGDLLATCLKSVMEVCEPAFITSFEPTQLTALGRGRGCYGGKKTAGEGTAFVIFRRFYLPVFLLSSNHSFF